VLFLSSKPDLNPSSGIFGVTKVGEVELSSGVLGRQNNIGGVQCRRNLHNVNVCPLISGWTMAPFEAHVTRTPSRPKAADALENVGNNSL